MTATNAMMAHRYGYGLGRGPRRMPPRMQTSLMGTENYGSFDDAVASEMFGADEEPDDAELDDDDGDSEDGDNSEGGDKAGFKIPKLPGWALPAAAIAAGTAGAVGLGLALTSKKRKAKRAARESSEDSFGAMGESVAESMFGDIDDEEEFGDDPFASPSVPSEKPTSLPSSTGLSWSKYKAAHRDLYRATKQATKASERLARAGSKVPALSSAPMFGLYGCDWNRSGKTSYGAVIPTPQDLQRFISSLSSMNAKALYSKSVDFVLAYISTLKAAANKGTIERQYESFRQAAQQEGGLGPRASAEAEKGISLIESISGKQVSALDRQAMTAVARAQAGLISRGLA